MRDERVLIIEDEKLLTWSLKERLAKEGYSAEAVESGADGLHRLEEGQFDLVLLDYRLPDMNGVEVLKKIVSQRPELPVILMTAYSSVDSAVQAMKLGAYDYMKKPFDLDELMFIVDKALETTALRREVMNLRSQIREERGISQIIGQSAAMREICETIRKIARSSATTVLIQGESGTGKGLVASAIHYESDRANRPFMTISCATMPDSILDSELFGHERGAFTDAKEQKKGLLEVADGGTVFLDEIGDISPAMQAKLLRFLEDKVFKRVGGTRDISVDVRVVAATNRDLAKAVAEGQFRTDLYYRLRIVPITLPPLRERKEDIPLLAHAFIKRFNVEFNKRIKGLTEHALSALQLHDWPGNVRELRNMMERAVLLATGEMLDVEDLLLELRDRPTSPIGERPTRRWLTLPPEGLDFTELERDLVQQALERTQGNQTQAARLLAMNRDQIRYRIQKFGIKVNPDEP